MSLRILPNLARPLRVFGIRAMSTGDPGSGAGKGGGTGGSIRDAGGAFGRMEVAHEEQYFRKLREEQLKAFKKQLHDEQKFHSSEIDKLEQAEQMENLQKHMKDQIQDHIEETINHLEENIKTSQDAIARHKKRIVELKSKKGSDSD